MMLNQEKPSIIGLGTMGHSIALAAAWSGLNMVVWDRQESQKS
jgi:3-hydroxyacyl-CoA dehydrogenase